MAKGIPKILIFESSLNGHRQHYLRILDQSLSSPERSIIYVLPNSEGKLDLSNGTSHYKIDPHPTTGVRNALTRLKFLALAIKEHRPQIVLVPTGDGLGFFLWTLAPLLLLLKCRLICVLHRLKFGYPNRNRRDLAIKTVSYIALKFAAKCSFLSVDPVPVSALGQSCHPFNLKIEYLSDPLISPAKKDKLVARREVNLEPDGLLVGCIGIIDRRKGVDQLIKASAGLNRNIKILLAGKFSAEIVELLGMFSEDELSRFTLINRFLEESEMFACISALDGMLMLQSDHVGISSFTLHSVKYEIPVICSDTPWFNLLQKDFSGLITLADKNSPLSEQINHWVDRMQNPSGESSAGILREKYSVEAFGHKINEIVTHLS